MSEQENMSYKDMVRELEKSARDKLKQDLAQCTEGQQLMFKRMYAGGNLELPINEVVDEMPHEKLDWAMQQVARTLSKAEGK